MIRLAALSLLAGAAVGAADEPKLPPPNPIPLLPPPKAEPKPAPKVEPKAAPKAEPKKTDPAEAAAMAKMLRDLVVKTAPDPLVKSSHNWGNQKVMAVRYREGFRQWTPPVAEQLNDGLWRKYSVRIPEPDKLAVAVTELTHPEENKTLATVCVACDRVDLHMEHQLWRNGRRFYAGETDAHCKGALVIKAEVVTRSEPKKGSLFPDVTLVVTVTDAKLHYDDIVVDKTAGFEGATAQALGDAAIRALRSLAPDVERNLVEKANAAIVKAAGTREFKVGLDKVLGLKK